MRLQKYMAHCGIASRRKCEEIIRAGKVVINGVAVQDMGIKINPDEDEIMVDGKKISPQQKLVYILLNKPPGYITTVKDPHNRPTVMELIKGESQRIYPIGRLDFESEGLLLLTNDGNMAFHLTHPRYGIDKEYHVAVRGFPTHDSIEKLCHGIDIGGYITAPAKVRILGQRNRETLISIIIGEGKNRQVRRMFKAIGHPVLSLKRVRMGEITLGNLPSGDWRYLTQNEIDGLKSYMKSKVIRG